MERISQKEALGAVQSLLQGEQFVANSGLDKKLVYLIKMRVSQINSCAYCIDMHYKEGIHAGETAQRLISLSAWRETPYYSEAEQAVLALAETLTHLPAEVSSDHILDEVSKHFSNEEIAALTLAIVQINSWNRVVRSFGRVAGTYKIPEKATATA